jgi:hypothetical protein
VIAEELRRSPEDVMLRYDFKVSVSVGAVCMTFLLIRRQLTGIQGQGGFVDETGRQAAAQICQRVSIWIDR